MWLHEMTGEYVKQGRSIIFSQFTGRAACSAVWSQKVTGYTDVHVYREKCGIGFSTNYLDLHVYCWFSVAQSFLLKHSLQGLQLAGGLCFDLILACQNSLFLLPIHVWFMRHKVEHENFESVSDSETLSELQWICHLQLLSRNMPVEMSDHDVNTSECELFFQHIATWAVSFTYINYI